MTPFDSRRDAVSTVALGKPLRLGAVSYLNTKPLVYGLDAHPGQVDVRFDVPAKCAELLHENLRIAVSIEGRPQVMPKERVVSLPDRLLFPGGDQRLVRIVGGCSRGDGAFGEEGRVVPEQLVEDIALGPRGAQALRALASRSGLPAHAICRRASSKKSPPFFMSSSCDPLSLRVPASR